MIFFFVNLPIMHHLPLLPALLSRTAPANPSVPPPSVCNEYEFPCDNGLCLDVRRRCNGYNECGDNSDEENCGRCQKLSVGGMSKATSVTYSFKYLFFLSSYNQRGNLETIMTILFDRMRSARFSYFPVISWYKA